MKFQNVQVMNFKGAFRGLRNPLESWEKSDSYFGIIDVEYDSYQVDDVITDWVNQELSRTKLKPGEEPIEEGSNEWMDLFDEYFDWFFNNGILTKNEDAINVAAIGPVDLDLAQRMIRAGSSDRKFMRQIMVCVDITAPLYWWKEFDTYKVGTVANSTSTMHKLASTPITMDCFEMDDYIGQFNLQKGIATNTYEEIGVIWYSLILDLEKIRQRYQETKDQRYWKELIRLLPEGWLQTRTVTLNYEILRNIYSQRRHHRLTEWHQFCDWIKTLPYAGELILHNLD